jgi:hypothetical protein
VKLVLDETKEQTVSEEQSEEFQLISPRLESFLNEPAQKKIPAARGPNAAARKIKTPVSKTTSAKKPVKMTASELEEDDDDDLPLDDEEIKAILARGFELRSIVAFLITFLSGEKKLLRKRLQVNRLRLQLCLRDWRSFWKTNEIDILFWREQWVGFVVVLFVSWFWGWKKKLIRLDKFALSWRRKPR